jgi:4-amino-4-deoxy-L-arabinose transferase-like glycosyltransferase
MAVARPAAGRTRARRPAAGSMARALRAVAPEAAVLALAAVLRLSALAGVPTNPYYDAAVRSMGTSWAAFLAGAFEPGRRVAIDKPPVDLWLQVASTRLLGFGPVGLLLPEALGGIALVAALMWLLRMLLGRRAALAGGLALAVLPSAVVVARSDTMDAVMAALATAGAALVARSARSGRMRPLVGAGALLGLAFDVKLAEALLILAAAMVLWLAAGPRGARLRLAGLALGGSAFAVTALAWLVAVTIVPLHPRPWALGASNGSPWQAAFVYNGIDRLLPGHGAASAAPAGPTTARDVAAPAGTATAREAAVLARRAREHAAALARRPAAPGPLRLLSTHAHLLTWIGLEAVAALAALAVALALRARRGSLDRVARGGLLALGFWLVAGIALYSLMPGLRPRYLAGLDPAVAGGLGAGVALAARRAPRAAAAALCAVLVVPLATSVAAVAHRTQDAGRTGAMAPARVDALSAYVRANAAGAANEVAASAPAKAGPLIVRDGRPILILSDGLGHQLVTPARLAAAVAAGQVRFALLGDACTATSGNELTGCLPVVRWAQRHGVDVSRAAGQPHAGLLYALSPSAAGREASGRTPTFATSRRTARAAGSSADRRASRARRRRAARARRASRRHRSATRSL